MKELTEKEQQWLEAFAKNHEFFNSFLLVYRLKHSLSNNQYYWLNLYINQAEEEGSTLLNAEELGFLGENSEKNSKLKEILKIHHKRGYLEKSEYTMFLDLKTNLTKQVNKVIESIITNNSYKSSTKHKIIKIPCPHCSFLCSTQIDFCVKCGEPLPKLEKFNGFSGMSDIPDEDYIERNIIHSLEELIGKQIPLKKEFNRSSTCYIKEGEEITGLSIFNCGLKTFPYEILRLKHLKHLTLRRNNLEHLPKEIGFFSNLEYLDLRLNKLETLPNAIGLLFKLKSLNLSSNNLIALPDSIGELLMLKELNLSNNKLREVPECIENLSCLETLNLKANYWIQMPECVEKLRENGLEVIL